MNIPAAEVSNIRKQYRGSDQPAVDGVSLLIPQGEIFGLLGPNGAGKTTTISILCGLIRPDSGSARLMGLDISQEAEQVKRLIGVVPQDIALYPTLTAYENLRYIGNMYGLSGSSLRKLIHSHLEIVGLSDRANKKVGTFSGGMKRRINLIAGILHKPRLLFLDEPTVGVDVQSRNMITNHLLELNRQGMTIIYTSHLMEEAENLCTSISIIDMGRIIAEGSPASLISRHGSSNLEQLFLQLTGKKLRD